MKLSPLALALAASGLLWSGAATSDDTLFPAQDYRLTLHPTPALTTQDEEEQPSPSDIVIDQEEEQPSPSDIVVEPPAPELSLYGIAGVPKDGKCATSCRQPICAGDPWELMPRTCRGYKVGGWFQIGYHTQGVRYDPAVAADGTGMFNNYPNVVQLHQAWAFLEKECDTGGCGWDWGFRLDYVYGTDGPDTQAFGGPPPNWDNPWDAGNYYGHAIPQAYVDLAYNNLKARLGHFYTIMGYEVVPATGNFFYSHAFTMVNAEPFTHTGLLLEYALGERITLWGGWTQGWDTGFWNNGGDMFLGGFSVDVTDNISATYTTSVGDFGNGAGGSDSYGYAHSIVLDMQLTERLNYVVQTDYVDNDLLLVSGPNVYDKKWSIVNYLFYDITECIAAGVRYEYYEDESDGILQPPNDPANHVNAITAGLNIKPHANVVIRPEVRFEDYDPGALRWDQTLFGIDTVITY
jgi:hypothetical protein